MTDHDALHRFLFPKAGIRGELVHLQAAWRAVLERHPYPPVVREQLGQGLAAALLLAATIKFEGSLIIQAQGQGPIKTLVAQATHERTVRGLAHWEGRVERSGDLQTLFGPGRLVMTILNEAARQPYQGITDLQGGNLAQALEHYFSRSEQLRTRLWLAADGDRAAGLFLQELPSRHEDEEHWNRLGMLAGTVTEGELLSLDARALLRRLFHEEDLRLLDADPVSFRCACSREIIERTLVALGRQEVEDIIAEQGAVEVNCEFCNRHYRFDSVDVQRLFIEGQSFPPSRTRH